MEMKNETAGTYETGVTQPGKSYRGVIAVLLMAVIFLSGVVTALGLVNVHLFRKLQAEDNTPVAPVSFEAPEEGISPYARMDVGTQVPELGIWYVMVSGICNQYYEIPMGLMVTSENHKDIRSGDVLREGGAEVAVVSRSKGMAYLTYEDLTAELISECDIIINTTPLGMFPNIDNAPELPYSALSAKHTLFDCVYNPRETKFLRLGAEQGAQTINGMRMFISQAEASWKIWRE